MNILLSYRTSNFINDLNITISNNEFLKKNINKKNTIIHILVEDKIAVILIKKLIEINNTNISKKITFITINELLEGKIDNMRFDYIVGNPPYQDNSGSDAGSLYVDISRKALTLLTPNGIIDFITPTTIAQVKKDGFALQGQKGLKLLDYSTDKYFNVGIKICRWQIDKSYNGNVTVTELDGTSENRKYTDFMVKKDDVFGFKLFEKIKLNKDKLFVQERAKRERIKNNIFKYEIIVNDLKNKIEYSKKVPKLYRKRKIAIHMGQTFNINNFRLDNRDYGQYQNMIDVSEYTDKQIENIKNFLFSDLCINICKKYRVHYNTGMNNILYSFPKIDVDKEYTQTDIQILFKLTDEEVEWLLEDTKNTNE